MAEVEAMDVLVRGVLVLALETPKICSISPRGNSPSMSALPDTLHVREQPLQSRSQATAEALRRHLPLPAHGDLTSAGAQT